MMMWNALSAALRAQLDKQKKGFKALEQEAGISHARAHAALNGDGVGTEIYLALCQWLNVHPGKFWSGDIRDRVRP